MSESKHLLAARNLAPLIKRYASAAEDARRLPPPLVDACLDAGLFHMLVPSELGGAELDYVEYVRVLEELGRVDGSVGWNVMIGSGNGRMAASMDPETARQVFKDQRTIAAGALPIGGEGIKAEGGYRLSGRWPYASGCQQSSWFFGGFLVKDAEHARRAPDGRIMTIVGVLPRDDWQIIENWDTAGMRGTGSHDIVINDAFVPEQRTFPLLAPARLRTPLYRMAALSVLGPGVAAVCLGIARHAIEAFIELAQEKRHAVSYTPLKERAVAQLRLAEAEAALESARAYFYAAVENAWNAAQDSRDLTLPERATLRMASVHAARASCQAVDLVFSVAGSTAIQASNPIERCWRDVHTAATHVTVNESNYEAAGRVLLGMEPGIAIL